MNDEYERVRQGRALMPNIGEALARGYNASANGEATKENLLQQIAKQCGKDSTRYFPNIHSAKETPYGRLFHDAAACASEAGELLEIVKKIDRGSLDFDNEGVKVALEGEIVDVFIYVMNAFYDLGIDPLKAFLKKRDYNHSRFPQGGPKQ